MNYKLYIYAIMLFISMFALSGVNYTNVFKKGHVLESRVMIVLLALGISYLAGSFIIACLGI